MRGVYEDRRVMGPSAHLPGMRGHVVLRQLTQSARQQTRARKWSCGNRIGPARGTLVILLSGRRLCGILKEEFLG
jgi:hypothetical protein